MGNDDHVRTLQERLDGVLDTFHSCRLDGPAPTRDAIRDAQYYIDGVRTLDELLEDVRRRHTRNPDQEQP
jgi:hypothetical protein